jgi:hypothetical protein
MDYPQRTPSVTVATSIDHERVAQARYPELFDAVANPSRPGVERVVRQGTGLVALTAVHECLTPQEQQAISEYRLHQYVLAGMYDAEKVARLALDVDPAVALLAPRDIHVAIGDTEGRFLSYVCSQSPIGWKEALVADEVAARSTLMGDPDRLKFPCELHEARNVFSQHPEIKTLPVSRVREFIRVMRNQAVRVPADLFALAEVVAAVAKILMDPVNQIEAMIGCGSPQVRKMLFSFGVPVAYAHITSVIGENESVEIPGEQLWTSKGLQPGRFWPLILATPDVLLDAEFYHDADRILGLPLDELAQELDSLRSVALRRQPRYVIDAREYGSVLWTGDPFYTEPADEAQAVTVPASGNVSHA